MTASYDCHINRPREDTMLLKPEEMTKILSDLGEDATYENGLNAIAQGEREATLDQVLLTLEQKGYFKNLPRLKKIIESLKSGHMPKEAR